MNKDFATAEGTARSKDQVAVWEIFCLELPITHLVLILVGSCLSSSKVSSDINLETNNIVEFLNLWSQRRVKERGADTGGGGARGGRPPI